MVFCRYKSIYFSISAIWLSGILNHLRILCFSNFFTTEKQEVFKKDFTLFSCWKEDNYIWKNTNILWAPVRLESQYAASFSALCSKGISDAYPKSNDPFFRTGFTSYTTFYNGEEPKEAESTLKLSSAFQQFTDRPELELLVRILNINLNKNPEILEACQTLKEYMLLIERIRRYTKNMPLRVATCMVQILLWYIFRWFSPF